MSKTIHLSKNFKLGVFVPSLFTISGFYFFQQLTGWWLLANSGIRGPYTFFDLKLVLKSFDCYEVVGDEVFAPPTEDPCNGYIYGRQFFYLMTSLNVGERLSTVFAAVFFISFVVIAAGVIALRPVSTKSIIFGLLVFISPSCWLLLERMNLDLLILLLLAIAVMLICYNKSDIATLIILSTALIKFYTFPLAIFTILLIQKGKKKILVIFTTLFTGVLLSTEILKIPRFPGTWYVSYGNQIIGEWWNLLISEKNLNWPQSNSFTGSIAGAIFIITCTIICLKLGGKSANLISLVLVEKFKKKDVGVVIYIYSTALLLICFFAGMNYDYRLFYIGISSLMIYKVSPIQSPLIMLLSFFSIMSLWLSCFFYGLQGIRVVALHLIGDVFTGIAVSIHLLLCLSMIMIWFKGTKLNINQRVIR